MPKVFIFPNFQKAKVQNTLITLIKFFRNHNMEVILPDIHAATYHTLHLEQEKKSGFPDLKFALALGGDGTILHMLQQVLGHNIPICGINMGQVGFLADLKPDSPEQALEQIISGNYHLEKRQMLQITITDRHKPVYTAHALNDIVLLRNHTSQMLRISLKAGLECALKYPVDGLIFATPTGSTAYSLSAGGPILHPKLKATIITPICPYAMYTKPLVVDSAEIITVRFAINSGKGLISADGLPIGELRNHHTIIIGPSIHTANFIKISQDGYYPNWQERLRRGEASAMF